jgi:hypothetical protein
MGERRYAYRVLVGKAEGKWSLGRHRSRWEENIKWILKKPVRVRGLNLSGSG